MTNNIVSIKDRLKRLMYFFPFRLLILHLKRNHLLMALWLLLFGYVTGNIGARYGSHYLFLAPEYLGTVNFAAFAILGFGTGGFIMAFNLYSYIMHGYKFPFIATMSRPFMKFCLNNFLIPVAFVITYLICSIQFQLEKELFTIGKVVIHAFSFIGGLVLFIILTTLYFFTTNKDLYVISGRDEAYFDSIIQKKTANKAALHKKQDWAKRMNRSKAWKVETYMSSFFKLNLARESRHYDEALLARVFAQNQINATLFEILMIFSFLILGSLREVPFFMIPAAASILLVLTIVLMLISAFFSWFKRWTLSLLMILIVLLNFASKKFDFLKFKNYAYGLDYSVEVPYTTESLQAGKEEHYTTSKKHHEVILNNWKQKVETGSEEKPKLLLINASGGGLRAALWTFTALEHMDSLTDGNLLRQTHLIAGSSGGLIGAAFNRELYQEALYGGRPEEEKSYHEMIAQDILNSITFTIATNDIFVRYQSFAEGEHVYTKDRGYAFEKQLSKNLGGRFTGKIDDYYQDELESKIPLLVFAPTIVTDGRRLIISPQPMGHVKSFTPGDQFDNQLLHENVEFIRVFKDAKARNLRMLSALRMNATFPYILPMVTLPSSPRIEVMDAGLRDNYGIRFTTQYLMSMKDWINENTSGVVIIQIRDRQKEVRVNHNNTGSLFERMLTPFGSLYGNFTLVQEYSNDNGLMMLNEELNHKLKIVPITLFHEEKNNISLSWHLTTLEQQQIIKAIQDDNNAESIKYIQEIFSN